MTVDLLHFSVQKSREPLGDVSFLVRESNDTDSGSSDEYEKLAFHLRKQKQGVELVAEHDFGYEQGTQARSSGEILPIKCDIPEGVDGLSLVQKVLCMPGLTESP